MNSMKKIKHFVSDQIRQKALVGGTNAKVDQIFKKLCNFFQPLSFPKQGQYLDEHPSKGQSYHAYTQNNHPVVNQKRNVIYIMSLERHIDTKFLQELKLYTEQFYYPLQVKLIQSAQPVLNMVTSRQNQGIKQYHAGNILDKLKPLLKPDAFCMIAVTFKDLYPRESWDWVYGLASLQGRTGVFSFIRHDQRFYQNQKFQVDYKKILWKSIGTLVHQIGHMFGLKHCIYYKCLMNGSNGPQQVQQKSMQPCPICLKKLQSNIKFDIYDRYQRLNLFLKTRNQLQNQNNRQGRLLLQIQKINKQLVPSKKYKEEEQIVKYRIKPSKSLNINKVNLSKSIKPVSLVKKLQKQTVKPKIVLKQKIFRLNTQN